LVICIVAIIIGACILFDAHKKARGHGAYEYGRNQALKSYYQK